MGSVPTLPGGLTDAQRTSYWLGFLATQESKPKGYWEGPRKQAVVFHRASIRKDRIKPLRDILPSERKKPTPKGRASKGKVRPPGYHLRPKGSRGSKAEPILASAKLPGSNTAELRSAFAFNDARRQRRDGIRAALGH